MYRTYVCFVLICIHVKEDSVIGSPFNVNWSLLFVFTSLLLLALYFFFFVLLFFAFVLCVWCLKCSIYASQIKSFEAVDYR